MTLRTPTSVFIPLNSQRTSSQSTQLCRSGRIASVGSIDCRSKRAAHQKNNKDDSQRDPINRERRKSSRANPVHEPGNNSERDNKRNDKHDRENNLLIGIDRERRDISFVDRIVAGLQRFE